MNTLLCVTILGLIDYLVSDELEAQVLRDNVIFKIGKEAAVMMPLLDCPLNVVDTELLLVEEVCVCETFESSNELIRADCFLIWQWCIY